MCGIAGIYNHDTLSIDAEEHVINMMERIIHRGPDEAGIYLSNHLAMGTVRLSILGIESGRQPIFDETERYYLCYNGEVYNYIELKKELIELGYCFYTSSDTEIVLRAWQAWGADCLDKFNGAFAFALYDSLNASLFLVRDRFGKRPLYFTRYGGSICFSSEMKSFLSLPGFQFEFDTEQLSSIFTLWTPLPHQSSYKGIEQVPNGSYVVVKANEITQYSYHEIDFKSDIKISSEIEAEELVAEAIRESIRLRLRSDVDIGVYLSGGLDSSIISALVSQQISEPLKTFSVAFEDKEFDESIEQKIMVDHLNANHFALEISSKDIIEAFPNAIYHSEIPVFRTAFVPLYLLSKEVKNSGIKVILTGEGADEAFLGYNIFKETKMRSVWSDLNEEDRFRYLRELYPYLSHYKNSDVFALSGFYQQFSQEKYAGLFSHEIRIQNGHFSKRILSNSVDGLKAVSSLINNHSYYEGLTDIQKAQWLEFQTLLPGYLLSTQGDRMSLANSVENRCPFLDPNVINLSYAINRKFDLDSIEKKVLREAFGKELPVEILKKRKQPYRAPDSKVFVEEKPDYLELLLSEHEIRKIGFLNEKFCSLLTKKIMQSPACEIGIKENQAFIFLLSLCLLHRQYVEKKSNDFVKVGEIAKKLFTRIDKR
jgi:asparagine synthase (glutamine-hydrolysing)